MIVVTNSLDQDADLSAAAISAVVNGKDETGATWHDVAEITNYSSTGACVRLPHNYEIGSLISLLLPIPPSLRYYDHEEEFYRVWGLVQHCHKAGTKKDGSFYVGVAFIGKNAPVGHNSDPGRCYRICGMKSDGLWKVEPLPREFKSRREIRYWTPIELYLAQVDAEGKTLAGARSITENVSKGGAAVISELGANVGERVKFISEEYDFSGLAVVCGRQSSKESRSRLHLRFIEVTFPVEKLKQISLPV